VSWKRAPKSTKPWPPDRSKGDEATSGSAAADSASLPDWLAWQAEQQPQAIGLRHKRLGIWQQWRWAELQQQVAALAAGLAAHGFAAGHSLVLLSHPRPEVLLLSLAAQWLGGEAVALDPQQPARDLQAILLHVQPRWLLVEDAEALHSLPPDLPAPRYCSTPKGVACSSG
jgi:long-subunit acyl-CoA synthetase (AMP-forming)